MNKTDSVLAQIAGLLNASDIVWGVGASVLLNRYGLVSETGDIDILVDEKDIQKADRILSSLGERQAANATSEIYATDYFYEYLIEGIPVDIMAGLKIKLQDHVFEYTFDCSSITNSFLIETIPVPFSSLEDWYVLYQLMPDKKEKVEIITRYFHEKGIQHRDVLERMRMNTTLPLNVKLNIEELLY